VRRASVARGKCGGSRRARAGGQAVNIVERRPPWRDDLGPEWARLPVARLRYVASKRLWTLDYLRHTGRWERYPLLGPSRRLNDLLRELADDPICVFWH
jgi:Protein of unknown function (DUF3024)